MRIKTHQIEPLIDAVLNHCFTPADAPNVKNEYQLVVTTGCKVDNDNKITEWGFNFSIEIPRIKFSLQREFEFFATFQFMELLEETAYIFAAMILMSLDDNCDLKASLSRRDADEALRPLLNKTCRICSGRVEDGQAFKPAGFIPMIEQNGDISSDSNYYSDSVGLVKCKKCKSCGSSFIPSPQNPPKGVVII